MNQLYNEQGYPDKIMIRFLLKQNGIEDWRIQYSADYGMKRAGILWKSHSLDEQLKKWIEYAEDCGVKIGRAKFHGQIHSIWFKSIH